MIEKTLVHVGAAWQSDQGNRPTGMVELRAVPSWSKSSRYATAVLTPTEARKIAIDLLLAAERAGAS